MHWLKAIWWWFEVHSGTVNEPGPYYGFFSGFGSDLAEFAILGSLIGVYRHHNCAVPRCPRFGHHEVKGTHYKTCHKHATQEWHDKLKQDHSEDFPEQHAFLAEPESKPDVNIAVATTPAPTPTPEPLIRLKIKP